MVSATSFSSATLASSASSTTPILSAPSASVAGFLGRYHGWSIERIRGGVINTRDAVRNVQIMHGINIGVIHLLSMSVQHTVDVEPLRLSSKGQSLKRTWYV